MIGNFGKSLEKVLAHEGGFSDHPGDNGGATMNGVTLVVYQLYFGANKTANDLKKITQEELRIIYRRGYWDKCWCDGLHGGLDYAVFDFGVNSGTSRAIKTLQKVLKVTEDGAIGSQTIKEINKSNCADLIIGLCNERMTFLKELKTFPIFGNGWTVRVSDVRFSALKMSK